MVCGLFYNLYRDEALTFGMFASLIGAMDIAGFYKHSTPLLNVYTNKLCRLVAVYLPALHKHLLEEGVNLLYFCSPWFLTSFTYVHQFAKEPATSPLVLAIFDRFLLVSLHAET